MAQVSRAAAHLNLAKKGEGVVVFTIHYMNEHVPIEDKCALQRNFNFSSSLNHWPMMCEEDIVLFTTSVAHKGH